MYLFNLKDAFPKLIIAQAVLFIVSGIVSGLLASGQLYADPPRLLHTTFEQYAKQQQQHDKQLMDNKSAQLTNSTAAAKTLTTAKTSSSKPSSAKKNNAPVNINQVDELGLAAALIGIEPAKAKAIIDYRKQHGAFKRVEDLMLVKGIGNATLEKNRDRLRLE